MELKFDYNDLNMLDRCNALADARREGREAAGYDLGAGGSADELATPELFFMQVIEPAWQADAISDADFLKWKNDTGDDPRCSAWMSGWNERKAEEAE